MAPLLSSATSCPQPVFKKLNALANKQWEESLMYTGFSMWFMHNELPGSAAWCLKHSDEERGEAVKLYQHLADRRIEEEGKGGAGGWTTAGEQQAVAVEQPSHESKTFEWTQQPNVIMDIKPPTGTKFSDLIHIWRVALERERAMSKEIFELLQLAREHNDYVTEHLCLHHMVPEQHAEEQALEEILENALLVTKRGPELYFEIDKALPNKPH